MPPVHELSAEMFARLLNEEVKGLFYLLRHASADLRSAPGSWVLTSLSFGAPPTNGVFPVPDHPWRGGLIGVIKTLIVEWPDVVAKSLVLENSPVEEAPGRILGELATPRQEREAYYRNGSRLVPEWRMVSKLRLDGRQAADAWLAANRPAIGKCATADLPAAFL